MFMIKRRAVLAAATALAFGGRARAAPTTIRIGSLQDVSGPFAYNNGSGTIACARQAIEEVGEASGLRVELLQADHQNKPDVGLSIARQWLDDGVDALLGFDNSAVALAVNGLVRDRDRVMLANNVLAASLSGASCTPNETQWTSDTVMLARVLGGALTAKGLDTWYFIRSDYVFGRELKDDTRKVVEAHGGHLLGESAVPLGATDFSAALLAAQASGAKVIALGLSGYDLSNCLKQASEFGVAKGGQVVAAMIIHEQDIHALGMNVMQGLALTGTYYWDFSDRTRALAKRITARTNGVPPNATQANAYAAVRHYLRAVQALGPSDAKSGRAAVARMKQMPIDDEVLTHASIRLDGRVVSDVHLLQVKVPSESTGEWDLCKVTATFGPDEAWRPMSEGGCPLVRG